MAKLFFLLDGNSMGEFTLDTERITIGRRPSNQIHIDNLAVSGEHAVIVTIGNDSFLEDLNSTNGTMVNGEPIKKYVLQHDDVIEFGKYQLRYVNEKQVNAPHNDGFEPTMMLMPSKQPKPAREKSIVEKLTEEKITAEKPVLEAAAIQQASVEAAIENSIVSSEINDSAEISKSALDKSITEKPINKITPAPTIAPARLQVSNGASAGRELVLNKTMTTLGKPGSQVAVINKRPNGYFITHVGGNSLPMVNGQTIGLQAHALNHGDVIELAGTKMEFFLE